jgi:hypothetical protein
MRVCCARSGRGTRRHPFWGMSIRYLKALRACSVGFLSIPWLIFIVTWLRPGWAIAILLLYGYVLVTYVRAKPGALAGDGAADDVLPTRHDIPVRSLLVILLVAIVWVSLSGAGGVGFQNLPDWNNKNAMMSDLIERVWPVVYPDGRVLNYYFALYLPASALGHLAGWNPAQWLLYGEVLAGLILSLLWLYSFSGELGIKALILFLVFGGLDIVGYLVMQQRLPRPGVPIEWWASALQFSGNTTLLFWVPQHCLPGWILTSLLLDDAARMHRMTFVGLFVGLCYLWSPFVTLGLVPIVAAAWIITERKSIVSVANLLLWPIVTLLAFAFYAPHRFGGNFNASETGWVQHYSASGIVTMVKFLSLEVGVYGLCIAACWKSLDRTWRAMCVIAAIASVAWVLVPNGVGHGGFTMRSSIPSLLLLFLIVVRVLTLRTRGYVRLALAACLGLGSVGAVQEITRSVLRYPATIPAPRPVGGVAGLSKRHRNELVMPMDSRLYGLFYRTPPVPQ